MLRASPCREEGDDVLAGGVLPPAFEHGWDEDPIGDVTGVNPERLATRRVRPPKIANSSSSFTGVFN